MTPAARLVVDGLRDALADPGMRAEVRALLGGLEDSPAPAAPARTLHSVRSLAAEVGKSERTIRRAIAVGELPATKRAGQWTMTVEDVTAWARSGGAGATRPVQARSNLPKRRNARAVLAEVAATLDDRACA